MKLKIHYQTYKYLISNMRFFNKNGEEITIKMIGEYNDKTDVNYYEFSDEIESVTYTPNHK